MAFGSRIHGNIVPIFSGVPGVVNSCDSRTREIAQFYDIPCYTTKEIEEFKDLYDLYEKIDYSTFNNTYISKFEEFEKFLRKRKLVDEINEKNIFGISTKVNKTIVNENDIYKMRNKYIRMKPLYWFIDKSSNIYHGIK